MAKVNVQLAGVVLAAAGNCEVTIHAPGEDVLTAVRTVLAEVRELRGEIEALGPKNGEASRMVRLGVTGWPLDRRL
jgi:hypothetical protein